MIADYHIHTKYSIDSSSEIELIIKHAIKQNINEICITDHVDYCPKCDENAKIALLYKDLLFYKDKYKDKINLKFGMEFGIQTHTIPEFKHTFDSYDFDFIILSCHQIDDKGFWNQEFQKDKTQQQYNELYYKEILNVIKNYKDYSILGHLDVITRYDKKGIYPFEKVKDIITDILTEVIKDEKGIEVNTSSFLYGLKDLTPSRDILKLYRQLGGEIITLGSDSHIEKNVGYKFPYIVDELRKLGYEKYCTFDKMQYTFHDLPTFN